MAGVPTAPVFRAAIHRRRAAPRRAARTWLRVWRIPPVRFPAAKWPAAKWPAAGEPGWPVGGAGPMGGTGERQGGAGERLGDRKSVV